MPNFPATKIGDPIMGLDFHAVMIPPSPAPVPMIPHVYFGPIMLWLSPTWPKADVFINGMPAATVGANGYSVHIPSLAPAPPTFTNLLTYAKRQFVNVLKALGLAALTLLANLAIAGIAKLIGQFAGRHPAIESFVKDVTGIDTSSSKSTWDSIKSAFSSYTQWSTWVKLLLPPLPYPGCTGSSAIGSPNVTVNGGPLGFNAPLMGTSCSDVPIVPNAALLGFGTVLVGISLGDMVRALAVNAAQGAVSHGVGKAAAAIGGRGQNRNECGCE